MLRAKPVEYLELGPRRVLACEVMEGNPLQHRGAALRLAPIGRSDEAAKRLRLEGVSTARKPGETRFDLLISGDPVSQADIDAGWVLTSAPGMPTRPQRRARASRTAGEPAVAASR